MTQRPDLEVRYHLRLSACVPHVTYALLLLICGMYLLQTALGETDDPGNLIVMGGRIGEETLTTAPWRLLLSTFLHADIIHLTFNVIGVWLLGRFVEPVCGPASLAAVALATAISGGVLSTLMEPQTVAVGASSVVYGLLGVSVVLSLRLGRRIPGSTLPRLTLILLIFAAVLIGSSAYSPGIDGTAHVGGGIMGLVLGTVLPIRLDTSIPGWSVLDRVGVGVVILITGVSIIWMLVAREESFYIVDRIRADLALRTANQRAGELVSRYERELRVRRDEWTKRNVCPCESCGNPSKPSVFPALRCDQIQRTLSNELHKLGSYPLATAQSEYHRTRNQAMLRHLATAYGAAHEGKLGPTLQSLRSAQYLAARVYHEHPAPKPK